MTSGIYMIVNAENGKVYVGQSSELENRRDYGHFHPLKNGKHPNKHLQSAWRKYGANTFKFHVIERCDLGDLTSRKQYWIDTLRACDPDFGYNVNPIAAKPPSWEGKRLSSETKAKLSAINTGRRLTDGAKRKISAAHKGLKLRLGSKATAETIERLKQSHLGKKPGIVTRNKMTESAREDWILTDPLGVEYKVHGLEPFCSEHGLIASAMANVARGHKRHHHHWRCRKAEKE